MKLFSARFSSLTSQLVPFKRNSKFKSLDPSDISFFKSIATTLTEPDDVLPFNLDWTRKYQGQSRCVIKPKTTQQVQEILKYCHTQSIAVVPQGGNTGLVGGSVPVFDEVVLSTQLMNKIENFDEISGILTCQPGCILENLDQYLESKGFLMPLDLGSKGTCQIGGNLGTNAGGQRLARYGSLHGTVLALQVVLANGDVLSLGKPLRKDNTGYDLKQLFIGSEGTLGIMTQISILTPKRPPVVQVGTFHNFFNE